MLFLPCRRGSGECTKQTNALVSGDRDFEPRKQRLNRTLWAKERSLKRLGISHLG